MRIQLLSVLLLLAILTTSSLVFAEDNDIVIGKRTTLFSKVMNEDREIWIYTPARYEQTETRYPVIYLLDGDTHFHHATGIVQFLATRGMSPNHIVIALPNTDRTRDLSPSHIEERPSSGGADTFLSFFENELFPFVESKYRTQPYRILIGHSLGGLFSIHTLLTQPAMFDAHIAISPWLVYDDGELLERSPALIQQYQTLDKYLYFTVGNEPQLIPLLDQLKDLLTEKAPTDLTWNYVYMENENHGTVVHRTIFNGLEKLYKDWRLPGDIVEVEALEKHYQKLSQRFDYEIQIPENVVNALGYRQLANQNFEKAFELFEYNVKLYPNSANVYDSLGEAFERNDQFEQALKNYKRAVDRGTEISDPNLPIYRQNLERMQARLNR
ncbi:hypothetical protein GF337_06625 [candidate division KSB1 bacterium]|nr:hypothetical protein [candidate division KSB1 bacterium]